MVIFAFRAWISVWLKAGKGVERAATVAATTMCLRVLFMCLVSRMVHSATPQNVGAQTTGTTPLHR